jgi:hypothetical protein
MRDEKFKDAAALEDWLITKGVDEEDVADAADKLYKAGFLYPNNLNGISSAELKARGLKIAIAQELIKKLNDPWVGVTFPPPQQQNGKLRCSSRILVLKCCFEQGNVSYSCCSLSFSLFFYCSLRLLYIW